MRKKQGYVYGGGVDWTEKGKSATSIKGNLRIMPRI
jgi:hypothetical protein